MSRPVARPAFDGAATALGALCGVLLLAIVAASCAMMPPAQPAPAPVPSVSTMLVAQQPPAVTHEVYPPCGTDGATPAAPCVSDQGEQGFYLRDGNTWTSVVVGDQDEQGNYLVIWGIDNVISAYIVPDCVTTGPGEPCLSIDDDGAWHMHDGAHEPWAVDILDSWIMRGTWYFVTSCPQDGTCPSLVV